jgi:hypothetical protein
MGAGRIPALAFVALAASGAMAQPGGPVQAAVRFHQARLERPCSEVWSLYSRDSQARMRERSRRLAEEQGAPPREDEVVASNCRRIGKIKPETARLVRQVGPEAVVSATFRGALPRNELDFQARFREFSEELDLIREDGVWKAELRRVLIGSSQARLSVPAGLVDYRRDAMEGGIHHKLEVSVATRVPREALEAALRDPKAWATTLPQLKAVELLSPAGDPQRAILSFGEAGAPLAVTVTRAIDRNGQEASLVWVSEKDVEAPVYMKGAWTLHPAPEGKTRMTLTLVLNPRHWPRYERIFNATRMARSLDAFQLAAGKKPGALP